MFDFNDDGQFDMDDMIEMDRLMGDLDDEVDAELDRMPGKSSGCLFSLAMLPVIYVLKRIGF